MFDLLTIFLALVVLVGFVGFMRTFFLEKSAEQKTFSAGIVPKKLPNGIYQGSSSGYNGSWQGKKFDETNSTGINVFKNGENLDEKFPFKTFVAKGVRDNQQVIKIDYNIPPNPWYLRLILDEIVEVSEDRYLGKLQVRFLPGQYFTFAFFYLKKK
ncbi:MAG: hypothetical protein ABI425_04970 [Patescibacteria group bacterium]